LAQAGLTLRGLCRCAAENVETFDAARPDIFRQAAWDVQRGLEADRSAALMWVLAMIREVAAQCTNTAR